MTVKVNWSDVRADYEAGVLSIAGLRARHGLTAGQLRYRREKEGWVAREPAAPASPRRPGTQPGATPRSLLRRLTAVVAGQVRLLEERMTGEGGERDARLAGELAKTLAQLDRLAEASKHRIKTGTDGADGDGIDWRARLKAKLDRLHKQGGP